MALIGMAVYSTAENNKDEYLQRTLQSLKDTVDFQRHRLILSVNSFTDDTIEILGQFDDIIEDVIYNNGNLGTAAAINKTWLFRGKGEHAIKMDDDVVIHSAGWIDLMEESILRDPLIGQIGLKRKDCWEYPEHPTEDFRSELKVLPHVGGERWIIVERVKHVIGTCVMHSSALLDKVGYLYQLGVYGYDDVIMSHRAHLAGYYSCFLPHIEIDHIDTGETPFQSWKEKHAGEYTQGVINLVHEMYNRTKPIYYEA